MEFSHEQWNNTWAQMCFSRFRGRRRFHYIELIAWDIFNSWDPGKPDLVGTWDGTSLLNLGVGNDSGRLQTHS